MRLRHPAAPLAALFTTVCALSACQSAPPTPGPSIDGLFASRTGTEVSEWIGREPQRCQSTQPGTELCIWVVGNRLDSWRTLAAALETRKQINVLCEVPTDDDHDKCSFYPRSAEDFDPATVSTSGTPDVAASTGGATESAARRAIAGARTMRALSDLVGDIPLTCDEVDASKRRCEWRISNRMKGYRVVAATIGTKKRVRLTCDLPSDGGPRASGSCNVGEEGQESPTPSQ